MNTGAEYCPKARTDGLLAHDVADEIVVYDLKDGTAYCLNPVAAVVWKHCDGTTPVSTLTGLIGKAGVPAEPAAVYHVLDELAEIRLLDEDVLQKGARPQISRRELLLRLGMSAALVLASVSAITVPAPAQAMSGHGPTGPTGPTG